jgi:hypothetical protein
MSFTVGATGLKRYLTSLKRDKARRIMQNIAQLPELLQRD